MEDKDFSLKEENRFCKGSKNKEIVEFSQDEMPFMDESVEMEKNPTKPRKKASEKQKQQVLENLKKGREILALKRKEQRELRERQKKEKEELKQRQDFSNKDFPPKEEKQKKKKKMKQKMSLSKIFL
jgi:hypothetical protein